MFREHTEKSVSDEQKDNTLGFLFYSIFSSFIHCTIFKLRSEDRMIDFFPGFPHCFSFVASMGFTMIIEFLCLAFLLDKEITIFRKGEGEARVDLVLPHLF